MRKLIFISLITASILSFTGCEEYLDVNTNPNGPDALLQPELFLPAIQSEMTVGMQWDGRFAGFYTQNWGYTGTNYALDLHANPLSDFYATMWRAVYWSMGYNLSDMIESGKLNRKYDFVGVGYIMRALGWQMLTDYHGPVIVSQAFDPDRRVFDYDDEKDIYPEIISLLELGIENLERTDGIDEENSGLRRGDLIFQGDRQKWKKFAYGLLAINAHRLTNKASYDPNKVIEYVDLSMSSNDDNALTRFEGEVSSNTSFFGPRRLNIRYYRPTKFVVGLLDGSNPELSDPSLIGKDPEAKFADQHLKDPRITAMFSAAPDGQYRGVTPGMGISEWNQADQIPGELYGKYFFNNNGSFPLMTYSQLQFIKAEAAWIKNDKDLALTAYKNGVTAHIDFVRSFAEDKDLFDQRKEEYLASEVFMPSTAAGLTISKIMLQKYIAQWAWGFMETWSDMRRYHYDLDENHTDDGDETNNVFKGFVLPVELHISNDGKPAYRARPRFNSEYMWNAEALERIGGFEDDYHTYETWFSKSE